MIRVCNGSIFDVAVDLRKDSETYLKWFGCELSKENRNQLWIPPGFAHGFVCLSDIAEVLYKTTEFWYAEDEHTIIWNDKTINIKWPIKDDLIISDKDKKGKEVTSFFKNILFSSILIIESNNIIFSKIVTNLHFYDFKFILSNIFKPMFCFFWNEC